MSEHLTLLLSRLKYLRNSPERLVSLDGGSLTLAELVAISRCNAPVSVLKDDFISERMAKSVDTLKHHLDSYGAIYGVNTGCGGNADARTDSVVKLQQAFLQHHQTGILPETWFNLEKHSGFAVCHGLPEEVCRAVVVLRCNSLLRGHSAIRLEAVQLLLDALSEGIVPLIPARGSISASGDLPSLGYLGGLLEGNSDTFAYHRYAANKVRILSCRDALQVLMTKPLKLGPKESLAILNGTAASAGMSSLVLYDSHNLAVLIQLMTAMAAEALQGNAASYNEFVQDCRPHSGQIEVARNLRRFLSGSQLCKDEAIAAVGLAQDRYALRTAPQWIGPQLEDLLSADSQICTEINSTTDNPLVDSINNRVHHGGNFQAVSVTSAMEKTRTALIMLGRLLLALSQELVNPDLNKGLTSNLCADDPSTSFTCKGIDINITAYFSELAMLGHSVAGHVQSAEMGNQCINSLALVSARTTERAVELVSMMAAACLFLICQALDLRARDEDFLSSAKSRVLSKFHSDFAEIWPRESERAALFEQMWSQGRDAWSRSNRLDADPRLLTTSTQMAAWLLEVHTDALECVSPLTVTLIQDWKTALNKVLSQTYEDVRTRFAKNPSTESYLGAATIELYGLVRQHVPFHRGLQDHPPLADEVKGGSVTKSIGSHITSLYLMVRDSSILLKIKRLRD